MGVGKKTEKPFGYSCCSTNAPLKQEYSRRTSILTSVKLCRDVPPWCSSMIYILAACPPLCVCTVIYCRAEETRFVCDLCNFSTGRKDRLVHHRNSIHLGIRYPCNLCGFTTPRKDRLKQHVQSIHEKIRYPCTVCNYQAVRKDKLREHTLIVHDGFTYKCDLCTEEFTRPDKLKNHKKTHERFLTL